MIGILPIDKPKDYTSFDVIARLRGMLRIKRIGHGGTLDPMATGVLPVLLGHATRACDCMCDDKKRYTAQVRLGITTDTQDLTGKTIETRSFADVTEEQLLAVLDRFRGEIEQVPPMYSAIQIDGQRLYDLARQGVEIDRPARTITIDHLELLDLDLPNGVLSLDVRCSKGTYIRTLCHDIGQALGCGAAISELRRTEFGCFTLEQCLTLDDVQALVDRGEVPNLLPVDAGFLDYSMLRLNDHCARLYANGVQLRANQVGHPSDPGLLRVYHRDHFLGLGQMRDGMLTVVKNFANAIDLQPKSE